MLICFHRRTSWPQGKEPNVTVTCLQCTRRFSYSWEYMRRGAEVQPSPGEMAAGSRLGCPTRPGREVEEMR